MNDMIQELIRLWQRRNIQGFYCRDKADAAAKALEIIPQAATVGISGSMTLNQLELVKKLQGRGSKVFDQYAPGLSLEESLALRRKGAEAEIYLASANAVALTGELVFLSAYGNRISGVSYASNTIIICGVNKVVPGLNEALKRAREHATPLNCKRLGWNTPCFADGICRKDICLSPEYKRMCCQILIVEAEVMAGRLKVIMVGEELGY